LALQSPDNSLPADSDLGATIGTIVWLAAGFFAWFAAPPLSKFALPANSRESVTITMGADDFVRLGCFLIGVFYVVDVTPLLPSYSMRAFEQTHVSAFDIIGIAAQLLQLALAFLLMVRPSGIAKAIERLRGAGLSKVESE
jgi:hypothetical protein